MISKGNTCVEPEHNPRIDVPLGIPGFHGRGGEGGNPFGGSGGQGGGPRGGGPRWWPKAEEAKAAVHAAGAGAHLAVSSGWNVRLSSMFAARSGR